ncbi:MAG: hypothetical protein LiPW39_258 [Parcubacteria group bacterium LiPW_39]|nr:MAG: hypothetical protein LiPW39_258 [Parcubacteria group bacterium LiPW_39]
MRKIEFSTGQYYHIYNRGVDKRNIFLDSRDYDRFLLTLNLLNDKQKNLMIRWRDFRKKTKNALISDFLKPSFRSPLIEIIAYCLNPNHYHLILRQDIDRGIEKFMHKVGTSYTKYFNLKNKRSGVLFQGKFKAVLIESDEYLLYLSAYVNGNNFIHGLGKTNFDWKYSSINEYLHRTKNGICKPDIILGRFTGGYNDYKKILLESTDFFKEKKEGEKYLIESIPKAWL